MKSFYESEEFQSIKKECESTYELYRYTKNYLKFQYDHSGITWEVAYQKTGGNKTWGHHNNFTEHFWNKYPEQFPPWQLEKWSQELFNVSIEELQRTVEMDAEEFDKYLPLQSPPDHYLEYIKFFPFAHKLPSGFLMTDAIEFVNNLPYPEHLRGRWFTTPLSEIHFQRDQKYYVTLFKPSIMIKDDAILFEGYNGVQHYWQIGNRKVSIILS
jgi:hypothetical protein